VLSIKELRPLARKLTVDRFEREMGPFALVQRPPSALLDAHAISAVSKKTVISKRAPDDSALSMILDFDDLVVATLPPMREQDELAVGRLPVCDLMLEDASVSKRHAVLRWDQNAQRCSVRDLGSRNGTWIDEQRIHNGVSLLTDGDVLSFGDADYWFLLTGTLHGKLQALPARSTR